MTIFLEILGIGIGLGGLLFAYMVNREKEKLENLIRAELQGLAGNICKIMESSDKAWNHFDQIQNSVLQLIESDESDEKNKILKSLQLGHGDITAAHRMLSNLLNEVLATQLGLFGTKLITHPEEKISTWVKND